MYFLILDFTDSIDSNTVILEELKRGSFSIYIVEFPYFLKILFSFAANGNIF